MRSSGLIVLLVYVLLPLCAKNGRAMGTPEESYNYPWQILESSSFPSPPLFILPDPEVPSESPQGPSNELPPASQAPYEEPGNLIEPPSPSQEPQIPFDEPPTPAPAPLPSNELSPASQAPYEEPGNLIEPPSPSQEPHIPFDEPPTPAPAPLPSNELPPASQAPYEEPGNLTEPPSASPEPQIPFDKPPTPAPAAAPPSTLPSDDLPPEQTEPPSPSLSPPKKKSPPKSVPPYKPWGPLPGHRIHPRLPPLKDDVYKCWKTLCPIPYCVHRTYWSFYTGKIDNVGEFCCKSFKKTNNACFHKMFLAFPNPNLKDALKDYCSKH